MIDVRLNTSPLYCNSIGFSDEHAIQIVCDEKYRLVAIKVATEFLGTIPNQKTARDLLQSLQQAIRREESRGEMNPQEGNKK